MNEQADIKKAPSTTRKLGRGFLWVVSAGLLVFPPALVIYERWLGYTAFRDFYRGFWCGMDWLCKSFLPTYFILVVPAFFLFMLIFLLAAKPRRVDFGSGDPPPTVLAPEKQAKQRKRLAVYLAMLGLVIAAASVIYSSFASRLPGIELVLAVMLFLFALWLEQHPLRDIGQRFGSGILRVVPLAVGQLVLILFLRSALGDKTLLIPTGLLLGLVVVYLLWRVRPAPVYWVVMAALVLMCYRLNSWQFAVIGDEYSFYNYAVFSLQNKSWAEMLARLFDGLAVYDSHPFLSSFVQIGSMAILGQDNFGWRFSSIYLAATSLFFFHAFFNTFLPARTALWAVIFLGASQYLFTFGKIGYNNLQALFVFGLVIWAAGKAAQKRTKLAYALTGAVMGLCFYVYPGALYILPLPLLLLFLYDQPKSRLAVVRWLMLLIPLGMLMLPLLFQPGYWNAKLPGTFLQQSEYMQTVSLGEHIGWNLVYAFFSYLYVIGESHYVFNSYLDPMSAILLPVGLGWTLRLARRNRFALFGTLSFFLMIFLVGASHDRYAPSTTRMFLLLPWFTLFAALGMTWLNGQISDLRLPGDRIRRYLPAAFSALMLVTVVGLNFYMAYGLLRQRTIGVPSLEVLFMRLMQRDRDLYGDSLKTYLFLTTPDWDIGGFREMRDVYGLPASQAQLRRVIMPL
jgi:hypothetical protein